MSEKISRWAVGLAAAATPDEVDIAPEVAAAYAAGGRDRAELFETRDAVPSGFDAGAVLTVLPYILSAVAAAGSVLFGILNGGVIGEFKNAVELWDLLRHRNPNGPASAGDDRAYHGLVIVADIFETELARAGIEPVRRESIIYRAVRRLLEDQEGTREFLDAIARFQASRR